MNGSPEPSAARHGVVRGCLFAAVVAFLVSLNFVFWLAFSLETPPLWAVLAAQLAAEVALLALFRRRLAGWLDKALARARARAGLAQGLLALAAALGAVGLPPIWIAVEGRNSLRSHAYAGDQPQVRLLLAAGIDPDTRGPHGETALMYAAAGGNTDLIMILLFAHAQVNAKDDQGKTALDYATGLGRNSSEVLLKWNGARKGHPSR